MNALNENATRQGGALKLSTNDTGNLTDPAREGKLAPASVDSTALVVIPPVINDENYTEDDYQLQLKSDNILAVLDRAKHELSSVVTIEQAKQHLTMAELLRSFSMQIDTSVEIKNLAAEHRDWAHRKMGELLRQMRKAKPGPKNNSVDGIDRIPSLKDIGISKDVSSKAQKLAAVPVEIVEAAHQSQKDEGFVVSTAGTLKRIESKVRVIPSRNLNILKKAWRNASCKDQMEFRNWIERTKLSKYPVDTQQSAAQNILDRCSICLCRTATPEIVESCENGTMTMGEGLRITADAACLAVANEQEPRQ